MSREGEEWDYKEKRKRRVVNYGRLSDEEENENAKRRYSSEEEYDKRRGHKIRREAR